MKKILMGLLVVVALFTLTSCGKKEVLNNSTEDEMPQNENNNQEGEISQDENNNQEDEYIDFGNYSHRGENGGLTSSRLEEIKNIFDAQSGFILDRFRVSGKTVSIFITTNNISKDDVKSESLRLVNSFSEDEIKSYNFQFFVSINDEDNPMMGYKDKNSNILIWRDY